jgi:amino-acid N-acetyltransferase
MRIDLARPEDLGAVRTLISSSGLPLDGLGTHEPTSVLVARDGERIVGTAALERYGSDGLLRSVAVASDARGQGTGAALTDATLAEAARHEVRTVYLLTETADRFFESQGFERMARDDAPPAVAASIEWSEACGESAVPMRRTARD